MPALMVCASSVMVAVPGVEVVAAVPSVMLSVPMVRVPDSVSVDADGAAAVDIGNDNVPMVVELAALPVVGVPVSESVVEVTPVEYSIGAAPPPAATAIVITVPAEFTVALSFSAAVVTVAALICFARLARESVVPAVLRV